MHRPRPLLDIRPHQAPLRSPPHPLHHLRLRQRLQGYQALSRTMSPCPRHSHDASAPEAHGDAAHHLRRYSLRRPSHMHRTSSLAPRLPSARQCLLKSAVSTNNKRLPRSVPLCLPQPTPHAPAKRHARRGEGRGSCGCVQLSGTAATPAGAPCATRSSCDPGKMTRAGFFGKVQLITSRHGAWRRIG